MEFSGIFLYRWNNIWKSICSVVYYNCVSRCCLDGVHQLWKGAQLDRLLCGLMNYWWCGSIAICANNWDNNATWSLFGGGRSAALPSDGFGKPRPVNETQKFGTQLEPNPNSSLIFNFTIHEYIDRDEVRKPKWNPDPTRIVLPIPITNSAARLCAAT